MKEFGVLLGLPIYLILTALHPLAGRYRSGYMVQERKYMVCQDQNSRIHLIIVKIFNYTHATFRWLTVFWIKGNTTSGVLQPSSHSFNDI